jgi:hypothetical protein
VDDATAFGITGIVFGWSLDLPSASDLSGMVALYKNRHALACMSFTHLVQALVIRGQSIPIWLVTRGAALVGDEEVSGVVQAPVASIAFGLSMEHPALLGGIIDVDPTFSPAQVASAVRAEMAAADGEKRVAYCGVDGMVLRVEAASSSTAEQ